MTPRYIRKRRSELEELIAENQKKLDELRARCLHPTKTTTAGSNTGNYDPSADSYWYDHDCPDCGKRWRVRTA